MDPVSVGIDVSKRTLVIAIAGIVLLLRRWRAVPPGDPAARPADNPPPPGDPDLARLRRAIDELR